MCILFLVLGNYFFLILKIELKIYKMNFLILEKKF